MKKKSIVLLLALCILGGVLRLALGTAGASDPGPVLREVPAEPAEEKEICRWFDRLRQYCRRNGTASLERYFALGPEQRKAEFHLNGADPVVRSLDVLKSRGRDFGVAEQRVLVQKQDRNRIRIFVRPENSGSEICFTLIRTPAGIRLLEITES